LIYFKLLSLLAAVSVPVHHLPPVSEDADVVVVMMQDGQLPEEAWQGLTSFQQEKLWSLACSGMMIQRAGWSGYVLACPQGIAGDILPVARILASAETSTDDSALRQGLQLEPAGECSSVVLVFSEEGGDPEPGELPLSLSPWLDRDPDTVFISSPSEGNAFFWTGHPPDSNLSYAAWRGVGTEVVPTGETSAVLTYSCVHGSVPSNLENISLQQHPLDSEYRNIWGYAFARIDSLIAGIYPLEEKDDHLLWIRGSGTGRPWRLSPVPIPSAAIYRIEMPRDPASPFPLGNLDASAIPGAVRIALPGRITDIAEAPVMESILERIVFSVLRANFFFEIYFDVDIEVDGTVDIWLVAEEDDSIDEEWLSSLQEMLTIAVLVPPGSRLLHNSWTRASFIQGFKVDSLTVREASMQLMNIFYPE